MQYAQINKQFLCNSNLILYVAILLLLISTSSSITLCDFESEPYKSRTLAREMHLNQSSSMCKV